MFNDNCDLLTECYAPHGHMSSLFLAHPQPYFLRKSLSLNLELTALARLPGQ